MCSSIKRICTQALKEFVHNNYKRSEMKKIEDYYPVLDNFIKYREFEKTDRGYKTENSSSVGFKSVKVIMIK